MKLDTPNNTEDISSLQERIEKLEKMLSEHQHLGTDGTKEFDGAPAITTKRVVIEDAGAEVESQIIPPLQITDGSSNSKESRFTSNSLYIHGQKDTASEQVNSAVSTGRDLGATYVRQPTNRTDFSKVNMAQTFLTNVPQGSPAIIGPSTFPPPAFFYANRTPYIDSSGSITTGGNTITDPTADFPNDLTGSFVLLESTYETYRITSNTSNVITVDGAWTSASGTHDYIVVTPIFLGAAAAPFSRVYVGEDIRLGYGASGGSQVQYIKWGAGSPEGVVTANVGSMYLRSDGGANTTLYIKESGSSNTGWSAK